MNTLPTSLLNIHSAQSVSFEFKNNSYIADLEFIAKILFESHPGVYDPLNPDFCKQIEDGMHSALQKLCYCSGDDDRANVVENFVKSFQDVHLKARYFETREGSSVTSSLNSFGITEPIEGVHWITLPTLAPDEIQAHCLNHIIHTIAQYRHDRALIFDLKGNGGGNSEWGKRLLQAFFGETFAKQQWDNQPNMTTEWRISQDNVNHVNGFKEILVEQFGEESDAVAWAEKIAKGMQIAFERGEHYYVESDLRRDSAVPSERVLNPVKAKIFVIIDHHCFSAALDFIDAIKAMGHETLLLGETTGADSVYMEARVVVLPSGKGKLSIPIKAIRNRPRGHNVPYVPDIRFTGNLQDSDAVLSKILEHL